MRKSPNTWSNRTRWERVARRDGFDPTDWPDEMTMREQWLLNVIGDVCRRAERYRKILDAEYGAAHPGSQMVH